MFRAERAEENSRGRLVRGGNYSLWDLRGHEKVFELYLN